MMRMSELLSVMSPQWRLIRRLFFMSRTHSSRYRCSMPQLSGKAISPMLLTPAFRCRVFRCLLAAKALARIKKESGQNARSPVLIVFTILLISKSLRFQPGQQLNRMNRQQQSTCTGTGVHRPELHQPRSWLLQNRSSGG